MRDHGPYYVTPSGRLITAGGVVIGGVGPEGFRRLVAPLPPLADPEE